MLPFLTSYQVQRSLKQKISYKAGQIATQVLGAVKPNQQALLPKSFNFDAHKFSKYFSSTHYGVMIPDFPEPYRYLSWATVIGDVGAPITHIPKSQNEFSSKNTATLVHGTALTDPKNAYQIYNIEEDIKFDQSPFRVEFKNKTKIFEEGGKYYLQTKRNDLSVDLILEPTKAITWFCHSKFYQHFSILMQYSGTFSHFENSIQVKGLCTLEHWKSISQYSLVPGDCLKDQTLIPLDAFSYQVVNIGSEQQLVLAFICFAGQPAYTAISYRNINDESIQYDESFFKVTAIQNNPMLTPDGYKMYVPQTFTWLAFHKGEKVLELNAEVDTPYCYGLAAGYVGAYKWSGEFYGKSIRGRGYLEYIDRR